MQENEYVEQEVALSAEEQNRIRNEISSTEIEKPVDPLDDYDAYKVMRASSRDSSDWVEKAYNSTVPVLKSFVMDAIGGIGAIAENKAEMAYKFATGDKEGMVDVDKRNTALLADAAGKVLSNYATLGKAAETTAVRLANGATMLFERDKQKLETLKDADDRAVFDFLRTARDNEKTSFEVKQLAEDWLKIPGLDRVVVDESSSRGIASIADPTNWIGGYTGKKVATETLTKNLKKMQPPLVGMVDAAKASADEASMAAAKSRLGKDIASAASNSSESVADKEFMNASMQASELAESVSNLAEAQASKIKQEFQGIAKSQASEIINEVKGKNTAASVGYNALNNIGSGVEFVGKIASYLGDAPESIAAKIAKEGDTASQILLQSQFDQTLKSGIQVAAGPIGMLPGSIHIIGEAIKNEGRNIKTLGRLWLEGQTTTPFFRRLYQETSGLGGIAANLIDYTGLGRLMESTTRMAKAGTVASVSGGVPATIQAAASDRPYDALGGFVTSGVIGMAGAGFGEFRSYDSPEVFRSRQIGDIDRFSKVLTGDVKDWFNGKPFAERAAFSTIANTYPDAQIRFKRMGKAAEDGSFFVNEDGQGIIEVNMDSENSIHGILAHEIGHNMMASGSWEYVKKELMGDVNTKTEGAFQRVDENGFMVPTEEFIQLKNQYNKKLKETAESSGRPYRPVSDEQAAREIFSEYVAENIMDVKRMTRLRNNFVSDKILNHLYNKGFISGDTVVGGFLAKLGVPFSKDGAVHGSGLFDGLKNSKQLQKLIDAYNSKRSIKSKSLEDLDDATDVVYSDKELAAQPKQIFNVFKSSSEIKVDNKGSPILDSGGNLQFNSKKEIEANQQAFANKIFYELDKSPENNPGSMHLTKDGEKFAYSGKFLPDSVIESMKGDNRFNPYQIENLKVINDSLKNTASDLYSMLYQPATTIGASRKYKQLKATSRSETPTSITVTKDGNVIIETFSFEKVIANVTKAAQHRRLGLWGNDQSAVIADVKKYFDNHARGLPGETGIGVEKRNTINELMGVRLPSNAAVNPLFDKFFRGSKDIVIRRRRLDRINRLVKIEGAGIPTDYYKIKLNLRPSSSAVNAFKPGSQPDNIVAR